MEKGEGDISYFSKIKKRKGEENMIFLLENDDGTIQEGTDNIKSTISNLYSQLYKFV